MVSVRKSHRSAFGKKCANKMPLFEIDVTQAPSHFDPMHVQMWQHITAYPNFKPTSAAFAELAAALDAHIVLVRLTDEIAALRKKGKQPENRLLLAAAAARRPLAKFIKALVVTC
jgi:hypothetical protein